MADQGHVSPRAAIEPYLIVHDGGAAVDFYRRAFDAKSVQYQLAADGRRVQHCSLSLFGGTIMLCDEFPEQISDTFAPRSIGGTAVTIHVNLATSAEVDRATARAVQAGGTITTSPVDVPWGVRYARLIDPFGHAWSFAAPIAVRPV